MIAFLLESWSEHGRGGVDWLGERGGAADAKEVAADEGREASPFMARRRRTCLTRRNQRHH